MEKQNKIPNLNLNMFDDDSAKAEVVTDIAQKEVASPTISNADTTGSDVTEGIDVQQISDEKSLKRQEFEKLIKGDFKEFYEERIKENLSRRFKENQSIKDELSKTDKVMQMLYEKYGIKSGDFDVLMKAVESDDAYLAAEADKRGINVRELKYIKHLESENRRFHAQQSQMLAQQNANRAVEKWFEESENLKQVYPDFNIFAEAKNPDFVALVKNGVDIKTAYEVIHHSEIISEVAQNAALKAEKETAEAIRMRSSRPAENGLSSQGAVILKTDVSKMTADERAEIARRAASGEVITF